MSRIGYIRVSTEHQETARQQEIMCDYQVDRIFSEKISGANNDRPQLRAMLDYVREGDTLYIESISRLGRSTKDLLNIIDTLTEKGVTLISHKKAAQPHRFRSPAFKSNTTVRCNSKMNLFMHTIRFQIRPCRFQDGRVHRSL